MKRSSLFSALLLVVSLIALATPALAGNTAVVDIDVSTKLISLTVTPTSIDYGSLSPGIESSLSDDLKLRNTGNVDEDFHIKGADAATSDGGGNTWTLSLDNLGENNYVHEWDASPYGSDDGTMTTDYQEAFSDVGPEAPDNLKYIKLQLTTPQNNSVIGDYETTVTIQATIAEP